MISNCGSDERKKYSGGKAGDQTGSEWAIIPYYARTWDCVLRHPKQKVREQIAVNGEKAAKNNTVGYDQGERWTYWDHLEASNYDPAQITVPCEADCSSGVLSNIKAVGYTLNIEKLKNVNQNGYTGNMKAILKAAGFEVLTDQKYLTSEEYLLRGDVLLHEGHHTATNLTTGAKAAESPGKEPGGSGTSDFQSTVGEFQEYLNATYKSIIKECYGAVLNVDGKYGPKSRGAALCAWKHGMNQLKVGYTFDLSNSNFGSQCRKYGNKAIVKKGSKGGFVYITQGILRAKGYYTGKLDGDAGTLTDSAIRTWQKAKGLTVDGECGANTWNTLFN